MILPEVRTIRRVRACVRATYNVCFDNVTVHHEMVVLVARHLGWRNNYCTTIMHGSNILVTFTH